jgi:16S rRNA (guanine527-N7)-methyltransferase
MIDETFSLSDEASTGASAKLVENFVSDIQQLGVSITPEQVAQMLHFCELIADYSKHTNLVGNPDISILLKDHVLDSLTLVPFICKSLTENPQRKSSHLIDFGTGAGFPAIVIAIACPELYVTMIEAVGKKCRFLEQACVALGLVKRTNIYNERAELLAHDVNFRNRFDFATARAVGNFDITAEVLLPFLRIGGLFLAQKSVSQVPDEQIRATCCLPKLGGVLTGIENLDANILGKPRALLLATKQSPTKGLYPRAWGKIKAAPLGTE